MTNAEWEPAGHEGTEVAGYKLERCIDSDALGEVYRASKGTRQFAVRLFLPSVTGDAARVDRLLDDLQKLKGATHPALVRVQDCGREGDVLYVVNEWVEGPTLREVLDDKRHLDFEEAAPIVRLVLDGLSALHELELVHGYLCPSAVFVEHGTNGRRVVRITDAALWHLHLKDDPDAWAVEQPEFYSGHAD